METARFLSVCRHRFSVGDVLLRVVDNEIQGQLVVDDIVSRSAIVVRSVNAAGRISDATRVVSGERLKGLVRDPLATRMLRDQALTMKSAEAGWSDAG